MDRSTRLGFVLAAAAAALLIPARAVFAATNVQDPSGKTVLVVDGDNVKADAAGKPLLTVDGDKILDADAVQRGDELWAAVGPARTVGLAVYEVAGGNLTGTWYNATGKPESFGSENLTGADPIAGGQYKITDAKAPLTAAPYTGTLTLTPADKKFYGTAPIFLAAWDLGGGFKAKGVGFSEKHALAVASSTAPEFSIVCFKMNIKDGYLNGQFYSAGKVAGLWSLKKQK